MKDRRYILTNGGYYLCNIVKENNKLKGYYIDKDFRKLYDDFEVAEEDRKLIYIETGLNLEVKVFKKEE